MSLIRKSRRLPLWYYCLSSPAAAFSTFGDVSSCSRRPRSGIATPRPLKMTTTTTSSTASIVGGDFAGLQASFSAKDGKLLELPPYLVPDALKEWGQEPKCLEVLTSESIITKQDDDGSRESLHRHVTTIYPATGCAIDNLETKREEQAYSLLSHETSSSHHATVVQYTLSSRSTAESQTLRTETILPSYLEDVSRIRLLMDVHLGESIAIKSPLVMLVERQFNATSSQGATGAGGGLDGRTVSRLLGPALTKSPTFAEETLEASDDNALRLPMGLAVQTISSNKVQLTYQGSEASSLAISFDSKEALNLDPPRLTVSFADS